MYPPGSLRASRYGRKAKDAKGSSANSREMASRGPDPTFRKAATWKLHVVMAAERETQISSPSQIPLAHEFERALSGKSWVRGMLELEVTHVDLATTSGSTYSMAGTATLTERGELDDRAVVQWAPSDAVQEAMDPNNVDEVFETISTPSGGSSDASASCP